MLLRQNGFRLFIDYRNLVHMFDPLASINHFARYQVDKLQHLAMNLTNFQYKIDFISGEDIVWSDMLSRWGAAPVKNVQEKQFAWPAMNEVPEVQNENLSDKASKDRPVWNDECQAYVTKNRRIWIPDGFTEVQHRLCIIDHAEVAGHRGA